MKLHVKRALFSADNGQTSRVSFSYRISNDKTSSQNISITLSHILLKLHEHRGVRVGVKSSCERCCKVPSADNYCWSKIGNGVITLLWQPWSWQIFRLNTTVVTIFPNVCLWRRSLCSNLVLTLKLNVSSHLHMSVRPMLLQCGPRFFSTLS